MKIAMILLAISCVGLIVSNALLASTVDRERNRAEHFQNLMFRLLVKHEGWRQVPNLPRPIPPPPERINDRPHVVNPADTVY